jgi:phosphoenolpyruvate carboxykinase (GTP)
MKFKDDGRLYAINPEAGFFGVAPGTNEGTNPNAIATVRENTIFTNCAKTDDGDVWWERMTEEPPAHAIDWHGEDWTPPGAEAAGSAGRAPTVSSDRPAAHANARFTTPAAQCPSMASNWEDPAGVPIDAFLFGGRRATVVPLVTEALNWPHGVFLGSIMGSEKTAAAAAGGLGELRFDPFAMLPFCGYNMAAYFAHWLKVEGREGAVLPKIFMVNWFRKDDEGNFIWPGFGENSRVLAWIFGRCDDEAGAVETPIGLVPSEDAIDTEGLDLSPGAMAELLKVDADEWRAQLPQMQQHFAQFGDDLPDELREQLEGLEERLGR